jgi:hypothetical protein
MAWLPGPVNAPQSTCATGRRTEFPQTKNGLATWSAAAREHDADVVDVAAVLLRATGARLLATLRNRGRLNPQLVMKIVVFFVKPLPGLGGRAHVRT